MGGGGGDPYHGGGGGGNTGHGTIYISKYIMAILYTPFRSAMRIDRVEVLPSPKLTTKASAKGQLEDDPFLLGPGITFRCFCW